MNETSVTELVYWLNNYNNATLVDLVEDCSSCFTDGKWKYVYLYIRDILIDKLGKSYFYADINKKCICDAINQSSTGLLLTSKYNVTCS